MRTAFYNENEPYATAWLRNLIAGGMIAPGGVNSHDIQTLDRNGFRDCEATQAHFFAGIGGWSYALRLAGWPDSEEVWTGSCPCQPFSQAGRRGGFQDERHLWPTWFKLIRAYAPPVIFGEQVASPDGYKWFDLVRSDLEVAGYACGMAVLCAAGVGAPHQRHRLFWVAISDQKRLDRKYALLRKRQSREDCVETSGSGEVGRLADSGSDKQRPRRSSQTNCKSKQSSRCGQAGLVGDSGREGSGRLPRSVYRPQLAGDKERIADGCKPNFALAPSSDSNLILGDADISRSQGRSLSRKGPNERSAWAAGLGSSAWDEVEWLPCSDGKLRPAKPGIFPLAHGIPARVGTDGSVSAPASRSGMLMGAGNAIVPQVAAVFIRAVMDELGMS